MSEERKVYDLNGHTVEEVKESPQPGGLEKICRHESGHHCHCTPGE